MSTRRSRRLAAVNSARANGVKLPGGEKKPFWAKCWTCGHIWPAAYLPMNMALASKVIGSCHCPMCGERKQVGIAKQDNGVLNEPASVPIHGGGQENNDG